MIWFSKKKSKCFETGLLLVSKTTFTLALVCSQSINQSINHSFNQSINQSINLFIALQKNYITIHLSSKH